MIENKKSTRLESITVLQTFGIFLVVLGHSYAIGVPRPFLYEWLHTVIYSFHMPLFIFISGFLFYFSGGYRESYFHMLRKKAIKLLLPYVVISSLAFLPKVILSQYALRKTELTLASFLSNIFYPLENVLGHFWFLPTLFMLFVTIAIIIKVFSKSANWVVLTTIVVVLIYLSNYYLGISIKLLNLSGTLHYLLFFWAGFLIAYHWNFCKGVVLNKASFPVMLGLLLLLNFYANGIAIIKIITAFVGIVMAFGFAYVYLASGWTFFKHINGLSYQIFLLSWPIQAIVNIFAYKILGLGWFLTFLSMLLTGIVGPVLVTKLFIEYRLPGKIVIGQDQSI